MKVNREEMQAIDDYTINEIGIPSLVLMERAAWSVCQTLLDIYAPKKEKYVIISGVGNNGADGIALARMLTIAKENVSLLIIGDQEKGSDQMKKQLEIALNCGVQMIDEFPPQSSFFYTVLIDGIFGIGLNREIKGEYKKIIDKINHSNDTLDVISLDIPSGLDANTGEIYGVGVVADQTITLGYSKSGLHTPNGKKFSGKISINEIGYPHDILIKKKIIESR